MTEIISVRFKDGGKSYYFNPNGMTVAVGDRVIIETSRGVEFGECVEGNRLIDEMELVSPLRPVLRMATDADFAAMEKNKEKEARAYQICQQKIAGARAGHEAGRGGIRLRRQQDPVLLHLRRAGSISGSWCRIWPASSTPASSCARSASGTRQKCWAVWASADDPTAAIAF